MTMSSIHHVHMLDWVGHCAACQLTFCQVLRNRAQEAHSKIRICNTCALLSWHCRCSRSGQQLQAYKMSVDGHYVRYPDTQRFLPKRTTMIGAS